MSLSVRFWGVRGSVACAARRFMAFGGNTSCLEVQAAGHRVILDSGTGIRELGLALQRDGAREFFLLLTHTHWDHINGFPFFAPASREGNTVHVRAGHLADAGGVRSVFEGQMTQPMYPVPLDSMKARLCFEDFRAGDAFALQPGVQVKTASLRHPNGATGYRIEAGGSSLCYVTDTEHVPGAPDENVLGLIEGADLVVYDATYTDEEFPGKVGWGHSTWQEGVRLGRAAGARRLAIFHHDPAHDDAFMADVERAAAHGWVGALVAREGLTLTLP